MMKAHPKPMVFHKIDGRVYPASSWPSVLLFDPLLPVEVEIDDPFIKVKTVPETAVYHIDGPPDALGNMEATLIRIEENT